MAECYGSWRCEQAEQIENTLADRDDAVEKVGSELYALLHQHGFGKIYHAIVETKDFIDALNAEAQARYPKLFH